jgi:ankyrin repeat protein
VKEIFTTIQVIYKQIDADLSHPERLQYINLLKLISAKIDMVEKYYRIQHNHDIVTVYAHQDDEASLVSSDDEASLVSSDDEASLVSSEDFDLQDYKPTEHTQFKKFIYKNGVPNEDPNTYNKQEKDDEFKYSTYGSLTNKYIQIIELSHIINNLFILLGELHHFGHTDKIIESLSLHAVEEDMMLLYLLIQHNGDNITNSIRHKNNFEKLHYLISQDHNKHYQNIFKNLEEEEKKEILLAICQKGEAYNISFINYIIESGVGVNESYKDNINPLQMASINGNLEIISFLITKDININIKNIYGRTALHNASYKNYLEIVQLLLQNNAYTEIIDFNGMTPLHLAVYNNNIEIVNELIKYKANLNAIDILKGQSPLHYALIFGYTKIAELLIISGANPNTQSIQGKTALHFAAENNNIEIIELLIKHNSDINFQDIHGKTPLHWASISQNEEVATILIKANANLEVKDKYGRTPLYNNLRDEYGRSILYQACELGDLDTAKLLIDSGVDIDEQEKRCMDSPLHIASRNGHIEIVSLLINSGAKINIENSYHYTPLHYAVRYKKIEVAKFIILFDISSINIRAGTKGRSLLSIAKQKNYFKIINLLSRYAKKGEEQFSLPFHDSIDTNNINKINSLINNNYKFGKKNHQGDNELQYAVKLQNKDIIILLFKKMPQSLIYHAKNNENYTALEIALYERLDEIINLFLELMLPTLCHNNLLKKNDALILYALIYLNKDKEIIIETINRLPVNIINESYFQEFITKAIYFAIDANDPEILSFLLTKSLQNLAYYKNNHTTILDYILEKDNPIIYKIMLDHLSKFNQDKSIYDILMDIPIIGIADEIYINNTIREINEKVKIIEEIFYTPNYSIKNQKMALEKLHNLIEGHLNSDFKILNAIISSNIYLLFEHKNVLSILWIAFLNLDTDPFELLLINILKTKLPIKIDCYNNIGQTILHKAVLDNKNDHALIIIKYLGELINTQDRFGQTPLHYAIFKNNIDIIDNLLAEKNINLSLRTADTKLNALEIAQKNNIQEIIQKILCRLNSPLQDKKNNSKSTWIKKIELETPSKNISKLL